MIKYRTLDVNGLWNKIESRDITIKGLIPRFQKEKITGRFQSAHIEIITGPRQSGKTTLLSMLIHELNRLDIPPQQIFYINLDTTNEREQFENPMLLLRQLDNLRAEGERIFLFIDEVQRLKTPGKFLKGIYDLEKNVKLIVSGSSSLEIKTKVKEFLTGRKRETYLLPISFKEIINHAKKIPTTLASEKFSPASIESWKQNEKIYGTYLRGELEEMAIYGGYPAVLNQKKTGSPYRRVGGDLQLLCKKRYCRFFEGGETANF